MPQSNRTRWPFEPHDFGRYEAHHRRYSRRMEPPARSERAHKSGAAPYGERQRKTVGQNHPKCPAALSLTRCLML